MYTSLTTEPFLSDSLNLTSSLIRIDPKDTLLTAVNLLLSKKIHRLPVIDSDTGNALFIVTHKRILSFMHDHVSMLLCVWMYICIYVYMHVCVYICMYVYLCMSVYLYICVCMYVCICGWMSLYVSLLQHWTKNPKPFILSFLRPSTLTFSTWL